MAQHPSSPAPDYASSEAPPLGMPGHDEGLLDEAIKQTFPASDPPAATQPGSTLNKTVQRRDAARREEDRKKPHIKSDEEDEDAAVPIARGIEPEVGVGVSAEEASGWGPNRSVKDK